jgi:hypothetical protein
VDQDLQVLDFSRGLTDAQKEKLVAVDTASSELIYSAWKAFNNDGAEGVANDRDMDKLPESCTIYEHKDFPGTTSPTFHYVITNVSLYHRPQAPPLTSPTRSPSPPHLLPPTPGPRQSPTQKQYSSRLHNPLRPSHLHLISAARILLHPPTALQEPDAYARQSVIKP